MHYRYVNDLRLVDYLDFHKQPGISNLWVKSSTFFCPVEEGRIFKLRAPPSRVPVVQTVTLKSPENSHFDVAGSGLGVRLLLAFHDVPDDSNYNTRSTILFCLLLAS